MSILGFPDYIGDVYFPNSTLHFKYTVPRYVYEDSTVVLGTPLKRNANYVSPPLPTLANVLCLKPQSDQRLPKRRNRIVYGLWMKFPKLCGVW